MRGFLARALLGALLPGLGHATQQCAEWSEGFALLGTTGEIEASATFDDGSGPALYVGGYVGRIGSSSLNGIAKWNGTKWLDVGTAASSAMVRIRALTVFDDGTGPALYAGGEFTSVGGVAANNIAKWDGASWSALGGGVHRGNTNVRALCVHDDGSGAALFVGGSFEGASGMPAPNIARWNGTSWSALGSGADHHVLALASFDSGSGPELYVGGKFQTAGGITAPRIARWSGGSWLDVGGGVLSGPGPEVVRALHLHDDGSGPALYAGGAFSGMGSVASRDVARWNGASWSAVGLLYGFQKAGLPFHGGKLCVKAPLRRWLPVKLSKSNGAPPCTGRVARNWNSLVQSGNDPMLTSGRVVHAQWFQRDPADPAGFGDNLTNGVRFAICP